MLSKKFRLTKTQIDVVYKKGRGMNFGALGVKYLSNRVDFARFAIVIPGKTIKKIVARNRLRRVIYDEIGRIMKEKQLLGRDYIVRVYRVMENEEILRKEIQRIFQNV